MCYYGEGGEEEEALSDAHPETLCEEDLGMFGK
jgi:hypothetical protein